MVKGPGLYSDIGKKARDLLYKDYQADHKFTITTYTSTGVAITSTGIKKGEIFLADVSTQFKNKNITTDVKVDTNSNLLTTITVDEPAPGLKAIFSFIAPDQRSGKVELQYQHEYAGISTSIGLTANPAVNFSGVVGNNCLAAGTDLSFDTASGNFTKFNAGLNITRSDLIASLTLNDKGDTLTASYYHSVSLLTNTAVGAPGPTNLSSTESMEKWTKWKQNHCQPNFWKNVVPINSCGPYHGKEFLKLSDRTCSKDSLLGNVDSMSSHVGVNNHDTISMAVSDKRGHIAVGTSTNGATFKIPGRVGDGPIAGSSSYADDEVGACGATGDGDIMMRFLPCYQVVESMRLGMEPKLAAKDAISRIARKFPDFVGAVFAVNKNGVHAGACYGWTFQYSVRSPLMDDVEVVTVHPHSVL